MTGGSRIVAIGAGTEEVAPRADPALELDASLELDAALDEQVYDEPENERQDRRWLVPALTVFAALGWSGFFVWANMAGFVGGIAPKEAVALIAEWSAPMLLIGIAWLIAMRSSRREALRFGDAARVLSDEAANLEHRLTVVNRELSLAREFLSSQSRDLESLGRMAVERISEHAERLQGLVRDNGAQVEAIATVSTTALDNMERLRGQLPVIASSAKDVANNIGSAGRTAQSQLEEMVQGLIRLNEFGVASERQVETLRTRVDEAIGSLSANLGSMRATSELTFGEIERRNLVFGESLTANETEMLAGIQERSAALLEELGSARKLLDEQEAQSLTSLRARLSALRDEAGGLSRALRDGENGAIEAFARSREKLEADVRTTIEQLDALDQQAMDSAHARIAALAEEASQFDTRLAERSRLYDDELAKRSEDAVLRHERDAERIQGLLAAIGECLGRHEAERETQYQRISARDAELSASIEASVARVAALADEAEVNGTALGNSLNQLTASLSESRNSAFDTRQAVAGLTDDSVRLLELLQASAQQTGEHLPQALTASGEKLDELERRIEDLSDGVARAATRGDQLAESVATTRTSIGQSLGEIGALQSGLEHGAGRHGAALDALKLTLGELDTQTNALAEASRDNLSAAIESLVGSVHEAVAVLDETGSRTIAGLAEKLGNESAAAIERVLRARTAEAVGALEEASAHATGVSRESALQLRDQLAKIAELTTNLEQRIAQARERAEEQVDNDFARRMALITESLNSNAIDIAKALSSEVTDIAWSAYLRGDRGVFTRRAVRLIDTAEARSIATIYGDDPEFREHVSRYIHDFEAMLRQLLSTRDGHALSVTLLSSDMGKLYVVLAQAIERLRD